MSAQAFYFSIPMLFIFGLIIGSFLNVVVYRLPKRIKFQSVNKIHHFNEKSQNSSVNLFSRSACPSCSQKIDSIYLTPFFGWFFAKGHCSKCSSKIPMRYPLVEFVTASIFALISWRIGANPSVLMWVALASVLITVVLIDHDTSMQPDTILIPAALMGVLFALVELSHPTLFDSAFSAILSLVASIAWSVNDEITWKSMIRPGDLKLLAVCGAWFGALAMIKILAICYLLLVVGYFLFKFQPWFIKFKLPPSFIISSGAGLIMFTS